MEWLTCFYCDEGKVNTLPATCPICSADLKKPVAALTAEELREAIRKKYTKEPVYSLAV